MAEIWQFSFWWKNIILIGRLCRKYFGQDRRDRFRNLGLWLVLKKKCLWWAPFVWYWRAVFYVVELWFWLMSCSASPPGYFFPKFSYVPNTEIFSYIWKPEQKVPIRYLESNKGAGGVKGQCSEVPSHKPHPLALSSDAFARGWLFYLFLFRDI